jgi:hypothetical protein
MRFSNSAAYLVLAWLALGAAPTLAAEQPPPKPGLPDVQVPFGDLKASLTLPLGKNADWVQFSGNEVWVGAKGPNAVHAIDMVSQRKIATVKLPGDVCAGLTIGFGSLWAPLCGDKPALARISLKTHRLQEILPIGPAIGEGGITASADSLWLAIDDKGSLARVDPRHGRVRQIVTLPEGSVNPLFADGVVWVTSNAKDCVSAIDARSGKVIATVATGPKPRFLTSGAGSIWTLNQGEGSVTRIDAASRRTVAQIPLGLPGPGGDIAFGDNMIWVTMMEVPLTAIDPTSNMATRQWVGPGGDSLRVGSHGLWITDYQGGTVARIATPSR